MASINQTVDEWSDALPGVELDVRNNNTRSAVYALDGTEFLIGTVSGCDLRIAAESAAGTGKQSATLLCLISRHPGSVSLRNLALAKPVLVNGKSTMQCGLADGDCIRIGQVEIYVAITPGRKSGLRDPDAHDRDNSDDFQESMRDMRQELEALAQNKAATRAPLRSHYEEWEKKPASSADSKLEPRPPGRAKVRAERIDLQGEQLAEAKRAQELELKRVKEELANARQKNIELRRQMERMEHMQKELDAAKNDLADRLRKLQLPELDAVEGRRRARPREDELECRLADVALREQRLDEERRNFEATRQTDRHQQALQQDELKTREAQLLDLSRRAVKLFTAFGVALSGEDMTDLAALQQELGRD